MSTLLDSSFQYIPSNKTDVQATWAKFGWVAPTKRAQPEKILARPVQFIVHMFELAHQHDQFVGPVPAELLIKKLH